MANTETKPQTTQVLDKPCILGGLALKILNLTTTANTHHPHKDTSTTEQNQSLI